MAVKLITKYVPWGESCQTMFEIGLDRSFVAASMEDMEAYFFAQELGSTHVPRSTAQGFPCKHLFWNPCVIYVSWSCSRQSPMAGGLFTVC